MKLNILLAVPTRGYVWHETAKALEGLNPQYVRNKLSVADCRNRIVRDFLKTDAGVLFMCDDDVLPPPGFADVMLNTMVGGDYHVVGAPVPVGKFPKHEFFLNAFNVTEDGAIMTAELPVDTHCQVDAVGSGLVAIKREVLEHPEMKRPFEQELDEDGCILVGQDLVFCKRARELGFRIGTTTNILCDHYISAHANAIQHAYKGKNLVEAPVVAEKE